MVSLNGSGINGILNTASGSKMKITSVPIEDIVRNEQNEYSIEGIDSLAASIHDVGLRQPIEVKRLPDGTYQLIGGERRLTAMKKLLEEGDTRWQMVPCVVSNPPELDLPISDELKELYALTTTNAEQRSKTDHDKMLDIQAMRRIYTALKDAGYPLAEYQRSFIAANLNMSESQVQRLEYLDGHLNDGFKRLMAAEKLPSTVATMISKLPEEDQAALLQRQREDPAAFNTGTVMTYLREKSKAAAEQAATDDTGAELTVGKDFIAEIRQQVRDIDFLLSKGDRRIQKARSAKLLRLQKQVREKLEDMKEVIELGVKNETAHCRKTLRSAGNSCGSRRRQKAYRLPGGQRVAGQLVLWPLGRSGGSVCLRPCPLQMGIGCAAHPAGAVPNGCRTKYKNPV